MFRLVRQSLSPLFFVLLCLFGVLQWSTCAHAGAIPMISEEEYRAMSLADRKEFEQKLKEYIEQMPPAEQEAYMQQAANAIFESLTPEQKKEVMEESARIEKMSEEEQRAYFKQVEQELEQKASIEKKRPAPKKKPEPELEPKPEPKAEEKEVATVKIIAPEKALKESIKLITEVTQVIDDLMVKIEKKEDFLFKIGTWSKKKKIKSWGGGFEWTKLKSKIDILRGNLNKLKDRDTKTKQYKYLPGFIDDKNLYATVYSLSVDLVDHGPAVRSGKGMLLPRAVRGRSHKALRALINDFVDLLFPKKPGDDLLLSLDKLFAQYEPEAKKIAAEEKEAIRLALAESKRPVPPSRVKIAGRPPVYEPPRPDFYEEPDIYQPGYRPSPFDEFEPRKPTRAKPALDKKAPAPKKKPKEPKKEKEEKTKKELQKDKRLNKFLKRFDWNIESIFNTILDYPSLEKLEDYLKANLVDSDLALKGIPELNKSLRKATSGLERIKSRVASLPSESQKSYKEDIKGLIKSIKGDIEKLIRSIEKVGTARQTFLSPEMRWAHFGGPKPQPPGLPPARPQPPGVAPVRPQPVRPPSEVQPITHPIPLPVLKESAQKFLRKSREFLGWF